MNFIEHDILLAASDANPGDGQSQKLPELLRLDFDQDRLVKMAVRDGVAGLLYKNLKKIGILGYLGARHIEQLQSFYYSTARSNLRLLHDLKDILKKLNQSKTPIVLLQGISLLQQTYKDIGLRPLSDIDLWVLPEYFAAVQRTLAKMGYQNDPVYPKTFKRDTTVIDVNTHILWADRIKSRRFLINANQEDIYRNCRSVVVEGQGCQCLNRMDQIIYLSLHAFKHYLDRLIWLVDIKNLLKGWQPSDWAGLAARSKQLGIEHVLRYMLFFLDHLFEFRPAPDAGVFYAELQMGYLERHILQKRLQAKPLPAWGSLLLMPSGKGLLKRCRFFFENLFPGLEVLKQVFPQSSNLRAWRLYLKRALQLVGQVRL